jgi:hypothetical protein
MFSAIWRDPYLVTGCTSKMEMSLSSPSKPDHNHAADVATGGALLIGGNFSF